jgi:hypothetical protein
LKSARGDTGYCVAHDGGGRCQHEGCLKGAEGGTNTASRMAAAGGASTRAVASRQLEATRGTASRMEEAGAASTRAASSQLKATRNTASRMEGADDASTWAAPSPPLQVAHRTVRHMAAAGAARRRAVSSARRSSCRQCVLHALSAGRAAERCAVERTATAWRGSGAPSHG